MLARFYDGRGPFSIRNERRKKKLEKNGKK